MPTDSVIIWVLDRVDLNSYDHLPAPICANSSLLSSTLKDVPLSSCARLLNVGGELLFGIY